MRIKPKSGDLALALTEVQVFSVAPKAFPPSLWRQKAPNLDHVVRDTSVQLVLVSAIVLLWWVSRASAFWRVALAGMLLAATFDWLRALYQAWPIELREVSLLRATSAWLAVFAVLREMRLRGIRPWRWLRRPDGPAATEEGTADASRAWRPSKMTLAALGVSAVLAVGCFYNLGKAQFWDHEAQQPSSVHAFDMRVYFPVAKYFDELRYDGLYLASVAAFVEDVPNKTIDQVSEVGLRDLRTHRMTRVANVKAEVVAIHQRFSPERWAEFKTDMGYFRRLMGEGGYLGSLRDHGGNATPVWLAIAHLLFAQTAASHWTFQWAGLLDPLLLLGAAFAVGRTFGLRTLFVSMIVFGANDFYMFHSNWVGATLRHDWMVYLALGCCALKTERWTLAGVLLALSALIRAFPALALLALVIPFAWWLWEHRNEHKAWPSWPLLLRSQAPLLRVAGGATGCVAAMVAFSSLVLSPSAWLEWIQKARLLDEAAHVNHLSLRGLVAGSTGLQEESFVARLPVFIALLAVILVLVALLARRQPPLRAALLGLCLIPVVFNPANYYIHFVFLLPLAVRVPTGSVSLSSARRQLALWVVLLAMCGAQYFTVLAKNLDNHFYFATIILFITLFAFLVLLLKADHGELRDEEPLATNA